MPRLLWLTDLHLNFASPERIDLLKYSICERQPDALLVGGDTGEAKSWRPLLENLADAVEKPTYFVLGNHDFYRSSIAGVRREAVEATRTSKWLRWLPEVGLIRFGSDTALVGHDGWADARTPEYRTSDVVLNDYLLIKELRAAAHADELTPSRMSTSGLSLLTEDLRTELHRLGDEAAAYFRRILPEAAAAARHLIVLTHAPPFRESCWHEGRISDDNWAPHFTCVAVGQALAEFMRDHPDHEMTVLCGHTHGAGTARILPNLVCHTGGARYSSPEVQRVFEVG
ncbi:MAG: metallophosphoesterase [Planctomycetaceae bacterium]|nr:metallophosphoesterase [Planctomycetaceae bacterium]